MPRQPVKAPRPDLFNSTVALLRYGATQDEASDALAAAIDASRETGKQATVTLKLTIVPNGEGQIDIRDKVDSKLPEMPRGSTLLFTTPECNVMRENPAQEKLKLRGVEDDKPSEFRKVQG